MKRNCILIALLLLTGASWAQVNKLLINENFTGYINGNLNSTSGGQGEWKTLFTNNGADFVQVDNGSPLVYPGYTSGGPYINVARKGDYQDGPWKYPDDPYKMFTDGIIQLAADSATFYLSFLIRVPAAAGLPPAMQARPGIALRNVNGSVFANFYTSVSNDNHHVKFGIGKDAFSKGVFATADYELNTTYLIVIKYDLFHGTPSDDYDDRMYLWVNPGLSAEPSVSSAQVAIADFWDFNFDGGFNSPAQSLELFQEANSGTASLDAFKVAYGQGFSTAAVNSAAAWAALSPAGTSLPFKFGKIRGYVKGKTIELEWNVSSEFNITGYAIERSTDGVSFYRAGWIAADNKENDNPFYQWADPVPVKGYNYYRIKNTDSIQGAAYSTVVRVGMGYPLAVFDIYPNPVSGSSLSVRVNRDKPGAIIARIFNIAGQEIVQKQIAHPGGMNKFTVEFPVPLEAGIYTIELAGKDFKQVKQFLGR